MQLTMGKYFAGAKPNIKAAGGTSSAVVALSQLGGFCAALQMKLTGSHPAVDIWGKTWWSYWNTPRSGIMGVAARQAPHGQVGMSIPMKFPLVWLQLGVEAKIIDWSPYLIPLSKQTGILEPEDTPIDFAGGVFSLPVAQARHYAGVARNKLPVVNAREVWNGRLVWTLYDCDLVDISGNVIVSAIKGQHLPCQRWAATGDWTVPAYIKGDVMTSNTAWFPMATERGVNVFILPNNAADCDSISGQLQGYAFFETPTWIFGETRLNTPDLRPGSGADSDGTWSDVTELPGGDTQSATAEGSTTGAKDSETTA
jgi:hypothetical protein